MIIDLAGDKNFELIISYSLIIPKTKKDVITCSYDTDTKLFNLSIGKNIYVPYFNNLKITKKITEFNQINIDISEKYKRVIIIFRNKGEWFLIKSALKKNELKIFSELAEKINKKSFKENTKIYKHNHYGEIRLMTDKNFVKGKPLAILVGQHIYNPESKHSLYTLFPEKISNDGEFFGKMYLNGSELNFMTEKNGLLIIEKDNKQLWTGSGIDPIYYISKPSKTFPYSKKMKEFFKTYYSDI